MAVDAKVERGGSGLIVVVASASRCATADSYSPSTHPIFASANSMCVFGSKLSRNPSFLSLISPMTFCM